MLLEPMQDADIPAVIDLANLAYRKVGEGSSWNSEQELIAGTRHTETSLREDLARPGAVLLLWREAPTIMGTVYLQPKEVGVWYLGLFMVRPGDQSRGFGNQLLTAAEEYVREQGGTRIRMTVLAVRENLLGWYQRRGYRETGVTEAYPYGDDRFGTPLSDDLYFVVLEKSL